MNSAARNRKATSLYLSAALLTFSMGILLTQSGCVQLYANLARAVGADQVPAEFQELEESRLAIVTVTDSSQYTDDISARLLSRGVAGILGEHLEDLDLVREDKIEQWRDTNGWDQTDFVEIGRGVEADKVLGIELTDLKLRDGATLYRGRCNVNLMVIDVQSGEVEFNRQIDEFTYPVSAGQYTSETTETRFRKLYLGMLAKQIARHFHRYDKHDLFALDSVIASQ